MMQSRLVQTVDELGEARNIASRLVDLGASLPDRVLGQNTELVGIRDFYAIARDEYWGWILETMHRYEDSKVYVIAVRPPADSYFQGAAGRLGALVLSASDSPFEISSLFYEKSPGAEVESLSTVGRDYVFVGESGAWIVWAERLIDLLLVAKRTSASTPGALLGLPWYSGTQLRAHLVRELGDRRAGAKYYDALARSFPELGKVSPGIGD